MNSLCRTETAEAAVLRRSGWTALDRKVLVIQAPDPARGGRIDNACASALRSLLASRGAVLLKGMSGLTPTAFGRLTEAVSGGRLIPYVERSSPRTEITRYVYSSTEFSPREPISFHSENSYQDNWPGVIAFWCRSPSEKGGATPISDIRALPSHLPASLRDRLEHHGYRIIRNYRPGLGVGWPEAFATTDQAEVERYCRAHGLEFRWRSGGGLRTEAVRPTLVTHPGRGTPVWFNHLLFFNTASLREPLRNALLNTVGPEGLPSQTFYGSGKPFEADILDLINDAYRRNQIYVQWEAGDVLFLDNMSYAHGREPYQGVREIFVAMSLPQTART